MESNILYAVMMNVAHSMLAQNLDELYIHENTTVDNFRSFGKNADIVNKVFDVVLEKYGYELSYNQMANGINLLLKYNRPKVA